MPGVCLFRPEIPQNTGNIGRLVAAVDGDLHLVGPLGFSLDDRLLKRAGLDYWPFLKWSLHESFQEMLERHSADQPKLAFLSTKGEKNYTEIPYDTDLLIFGQETKGLPDKMREHYRDHLYRIPIFNENVRSLNLANSVSIVLYDQLSGRSKGFSM